MNRQHLNKASEYKLAAAIRVCPGTYKVSLPSQQVAPDTRSTIATGKEVRTVQYLSVQSRTHKCSTMRKVKIYYIIIRSKT